MKSVIFTTAKLAFTVVLFVLALRSVNIHDLPREMQKLPFALLALAIGLMLVQLLASALRFSFITEILAGSVKFSDLFNINWVGAFFSQALVTFVSGDVVRAMLLKRSCGIPKRESINAVTLDRAVGLLSTLVIVCATVPWSIQLTGDQLMHDSMEGLAIASGFAIAAFTLVGYLARNTKLANVAKGNSRTRKFIVLLVDLVSVARHLFRAHNKLPQILVTSLVIQVINVGIIYCLITGMGANVSFWQCMMIVPTVLLISLLPFSVAGWGLRETAMSTGFALVHTSTSAAVAASVIFGILTILISLPGGLLWWWSRNHPPSHTRQPTTVAHDG